MTLPPSETERDPENNARLRQISRLRIHSKAPSESALGPSLYAPSYTDNHPSIVFS